MNYENDFQKPVLTELDNLMQLAQAIEKSCHPLPHAEIKK
jgi:hypothetical protein